MFTALVEAQKNLGSVTKDAKNDWGKYGYTSAEEMISRCRKALLDSSLAFTRLDWQYADDRVTSRFVLVHAASGQSMEFGNTMLVMPSKNPDKSILAALTTVLNYTLRDLLIVPRVDEKQPEIDSRPATPRKHTPDLLESPEAAPDWMSKAFGLVLGMKDDPEDYVKRILRAATEKYGCKFESVSSLPEGYMMQVFKTHGFSVSIQGRKVEKENENGL